MKITVQTARCCTDWPVLVGVRWRTCGECGEWPAPVPGTVREVEYEPSGPHIVAEVRRKADR